jgi:hypothetical protein
METVFEKITMENHLGKLKLALDILDVTSAYFPAGKDIEIEHLLLPLNINMDPPLKIQVHYLNDPEHVHGIAGFDDLNLLQFFVEIPLEVHDDKALPLIILFLRLNGMIPYGNFGITGEGLYFRFIYPSRERITNYGLMVQILDSISRYVSAIAPALAEFISGAKTLEQAYKNSMENIQGLVVK